MNYTLGIDIGIASVGFAGVSHDQKKILFCGTHIFEAAENPKDGASLAAPRREKRGMRRVIGRRRQRKKQIRALLARHGLKDIESIDQSKLEAVALSPWQLRKAALERKLEDGEFARVLFHIAKRRGFQSNKKGNTEENDTEGKKVISGAIELEEKAFNSGAKTIASYLATQSKKRNGDGDYSNSIKRDAVREEIKLIFETQRKFGNEKATEEFRLEYAGSGKKEERNTREGDGIAFYQRPLQSSEHLVGECTFEDGEKRAPKFSYTAELFVLWSRLNNTRIKDTKSNERELSQDEKNRIVDLAHKNKSGVTYKQARKELGLSDDERFNISYRKLKDEDNDWMKIREATEKRDFLTLNGYHTLKEALDTGSETDWQNWLHTRCGALDDIARILSFFEDKKQVDELLSRHNLTNEEKERLCKITHFSKSVDLSLKAIRKILPEMQNGMGYPEACKKVWGDHRRKMGSKDSNLVPKFENLRNPVVNRALAQTRKVINACIRKYGMPDRIIVELAREVGKPHTGYWIDSTGKKKKGKGDPSKGDRYIPGHSKKEIEAENLRNWEKKKNAAKNVAELLGINPVLVSGGDVLRYRLWQEQRQACPYCGEIISAAKFVAANQTQVDHILPYAQSYDDSYANKVLVHAECNQEKGDRIPFMIWGGKAIWNNIITNAQFLPKAKQERLLIEEFDGRAADWKKRSINDTRYMARELKDHLNDHLSSKVEVRNGAITSHLRGMWGFTDEKIDEIIQILVSNSDQKEMKKKLLEIGLKDYHAQAALECIHLNRADLKKALRGIINYKDRTNDRHHALDAIVVACSTQSMVQNVSEANRYRRDKREYPTPWDTFREDALAAVYGEEGENGKREGGIFVSRMPVRKITGAAHQETIRSIRKSDGKIIQRVKLKSLKLSNLENLVDKQRNIKLYNLLKERLVAHGDKPEKAFAEPVFMPVTDPSKHKPRVNSVRIETTEKSGIVINEGLASNGDMVRVDVFGKYNKRGRLEYYLCPLYANDFSKKALPTKVAVSGGNEKDWIDTDSSFEFLFSIQKNDFLRIVKNEKDVQEGYFVDMNRNTVSISIRTHDNDPSFGKDGIKSSIGVKTLLAFEKYSVDYFGNKHRIVKEQRLGVAQCNDPKPGKTVPVKGAVKAAE